MSTFVGNASNEEVIVPANDTKKLVDKLGRIEEKWNRFIHNRTLKLVATLLEEVSEYLNPK